MRRAGQSQAPLSYAAQGRHTSRVASARTLGVTRHRQPLSIDAEDTATDAESVLAHSGDAEVASRCRCCSARDRRQSRKSVSPLLPRFVRNGTTKPRSRAVRARLVSSSHGGVPLSRRRARCVAGDSSKSLERTRASFLQVASVRAPWSNLLRARRATARQAGSTPVRRLRSSPGCIR